ncbi:sugar ABC transporter ATP-binding protein [Celeribacter sp.]|uniref:sugar ABC transporter ATP-binding protein n=1 Tax=Celeribacter sp. TaxID=1890673 RepID=UPI003A8E2906
MPHLELSQMTKSFGATQALKEGNLSLHSSEVHMLVGSNGSGKSTLCKIIAGSVEADSGTISLNGKAVNIKSPSDARKLGVSIFFQELSLSNNRTAAENIVLNALPARRGLLDRKSIQEQAKSALEPFAEVMGAAFDLDTPVGQLRADQRQMIEIMKTFHSGGDILIFDEPTSALDRSQSEAFFNEIERRKADGASIIFISHRMEEVFDIGDRVTVIRDGKTVYSSRISETSQKHLVAQMVGIEQDHDGFAAAPDRPVATDVHMTVHNLSSGKLKPTSFELKRGEILGLGGLHGQGQSDLLRSLAGLTRATGTVHLDGKTLNLKSPRTAILQGMAYVSGDRRNDGAITGRTILENVTPISLLKRGTMFLRSGPQSKSAKTALSHLSTKYEGLSASIDALSGGNQQKVIISRWLTDKPDVLLLDDPTKGIDISTKIELFDLIRELAQSGLSIILYSSEDAELLANSDRILVFNNGEVCKELTGADRTKTKLTQAAFEAAQ